MMKFLLLGLCLLCGCDSAGNTHLLVEVDAPKGSTVAINNIMIEDNMYPRVRGSAIEQLFRLRCGRKYQIDVYHEGKHIHHNENFIVPQISCSFVYKYKLEGK